MLASKIDPAGTLTPQQAAVLMAKLRNADGISMVPITVKGDTLNIDTKGGTKMLARKIDPAGILTPQQAAVLVAKLRNADGISMVPITVKGDTLNIGTDEREFVDDLDFIGRKLGYRVHSV